MSDHFLYRPKFVDIRIRKPMRPAEPQAQAQRCEHPGCTAEAVARAPKSRENPKEMWWFCAEHAALYNRNWNYFDGMSEGEFDAFQQAAAHGHRASWSFKAPPNARPTGGGSGSSRRAWQAGATGPEWADPHGAFRGRRGGTGRATADQPDGRTPTPIREALETLELPPEASRDDVRRSYTELVRRYHPDANGGDRSAEDRLSAVVKAYKMLKTARRA